MGAKTIGTDTFGGKTFRASERTFAHLDDTQRRLTAKHPKARLRVIQGCYSHGSLSAGTHDFDAVLDVEIVGMPGLSAADRWSNSQKFLRQCGWAAWWRHTGTWSRQSTWHIHMVSLGYETKVGEFVPGQVADYYRHALGLKGQHGSGSDGSWFPKDIASTVFVYPPKAVPKPVTSKTPSIDAEVLAYREGITSGQDALKAHKSGPVHDHLVKSVNLGSQALAEAQAAQKLAQK